MTARYRNRGSSGEMDHITSERINDSHIAEDSSDGGEKGGSNEFYEEEEEEEDGVYTIEYSNPEEEGESYKFKILLDRSNSGKKPVIKPLPVREIPKEPVSFRPQSQTQETSQKMEVKTDEENDESFLEPGENHREPMETDSGSGKKLVCPKCPASGKFFKRPSGLARHVRYMHSSEKRKTYFCTSCNQAVRSQIELDAHTRRHANQEAVFTCSLCSESKRFRGSKLDLRKHLEKKHKGIIPDCNICKKRFKTLVRYLDDQFRHVAVTPYHCARCQIYEMTERGLSIHKKNHDKKKKKKSGQNQPRRLEVNTDD